VTRYQVADLIDALADAGDRLLDEDGWDCHLCGEWVRHEDTEGNTGKYWAGVCRTCCREEWRPS
jgi:hypothetical protein